MKEELIITFTGRFNEIFVELIFELSLGKKRGLNSEKEKINKDA